MSTIIWIGLGWIGASLLFGWGWYRWKRHEKRLVDQMRLALDDLNDDDEPVGRDFVMERAKLEADREDAEEGRQERLREKKEGKP